MLKIRKEKKTISTLNGSFDILHSGHLSIIYQASLMGDVFIMALNTDESIQKYKGRQRPIISLNHRLSSIAALEFVDYVTYFSEQNPISVLEKIRPDIHNNGAEYGENCIEAGVVAKYGGNINIIPLVPNLSTTNIIEKIKRL